MLTVCYRKHTQLLAGICFWRKGREERVSAEFMGEKGGYTANTPREIEIDGGDKGTRSFHSFRHFFISSLANAQIGEDIRMTLAAHSSSDVHQLYAKHSTDTLRDAISVLPDFRADAA